MTTTRDTSEARTSEHLPGGLAAGVGRPRSELLIRRYTKHGWLWNAAALVVPVLAVFAFHKGLQLRDLGREERGNTIIVFAVLILLVRLGLYLTS